MLFKLLSSFGITQILTIAILTGLGLVTFNQLNKKNKELRQVKDQLIQCQQTKSQLQDELLNIRSIYNEQLVKQRKELQRLHQKLQSVNIANQYNIQKPNTGDECTDLKLQLEQFKQIELRSPEQSKESQQR